MDRFLIRLPHALVFTGLALGTSLVASSSRADLPSPPSPSANPGPGPTPQDDSRFGEIGHTYDDSEAARRPFGVGVGATNVGRVTYAGTRIDVPIAQRWSLIPQAALLNVRPSDPTATSSTNVYVGGGIGFRPADDWQLETSVIYGPQAFGLKSIGGSFSVAKEFGADWSRDQPPPATVQLTASATRFEWANGNGPAGSDVVQGYLQAQVFFLAGKRLQITPKGMLFVYDKTLSQAQGQRLGTVSALARIGSYAPRAMVGARLGYLIGTWLTPFVDGEEIFYVEDIGSAQRLVGGARFRVAREMYVAGYGGAIVNHVGGPLVAPDENLRTVPVVGLELELSL
jgi:hypothetical protein